MEKYKKSYKNYKIKVSAPTWNEEFELLDGSYSASNIKDYFEYIIKKHKTFTDNLPVKIHANRIENRITFKIKPGYYVELSTLETMKLLGNTKSKITKCASFRNY